MRFSGRNLTCVRGGREVFAAVSFRLPEGQALLLRGPNGSGKSSLLRMAAGLLPPAAGAFEWEGRPEGGAICWVSHADAVKPALTVAENLALWLGLEAGEAPDPAPALEALGLGPLADLPAAYLSAGQRRRLNLARLAGSPAPLWLVDEPTVSLDEEAVDLLLAVVRGHLARGGMALVATHAALDLPAGELRLGRSA